HLLGDFARRLRFDPVEGRRQGQGCRRTARSHGQAAAGAGPGRQAGARADRRRTPQPEADRHAPEGGAAQRTRRARRPADGRAAGAALPPPARVWCLRSGLTAHDIGCPMHPILILSILLQIGFAVHVARTGRPMYWIFILLVGSYIGIAIYFFAEVLPELHGSRGARRAVDSLHNRIDPERQKRHASRQLDLVDTPENRRRLAEQSLLTGDYQHAMEQYRSALKGLYKTDPDLMLGLAKAQFALDLPQEAKQTLDELIAANPSYRSSEGHLLYARSVEA